LRNRFVALPRWKYPVWNFTPAFSIAAAIA
jgi:hypothetical protein